MKKAGYYQYIVDTAGFKIHFVHNPVSVLSRLLSFQVRVTPTRTEIIILATRTQNVLGDKGRRIRELTAVIQKRFNFAVSLDFFNKNFISKYRYIFLLFEGKFPNLSISRNIVPFKITCIIGWFIKIKSARIITDQG